MFWPRRKSQRFMTLFIMCVCSVGLLWQLIRMLNRTMIAHPHHNMSGHVKLVTKIHVLASMRTGSSHVGNILAKHPDSFFVFEPLWPMNELKRRSANDSKQNAELLKNILNCELPESVIFNQITMFYNFAHFNDSFTTLRECIEKYSTTDFNSFKHHNQFPEKCLQELKDNCEASTVRIVKTIRVDASSMIELSRIDPSIRTILLVRDPRPMFLSRAKQGYSKLVNSSELKTTEVICNDITENIETAQSLYIDDVYFLRYEDLVANPLYVIESLVKFAKIPAHKPIHTWRGMATLLKGASDHRNDLRNKTLAWKQSYTTNVNRLMEIERTCDRLFQLSGYVPFGNKTNLENDVKNSLTIPKEPWKHCSFIF